jgi:succinoglycan biosynthesis protein ExoA
VSENLPSVTVLIAARPGQVIVKAVEASRVLNYPEDKFEIIVARGRQPSVQRNVGLKSARGALIYFLDDDSVPVPDNLRTAVRHFDRKEVQMVGGPNLCPADAPNLEKIFALVLGSWLAFGPSRARYTQVGQRRTTSEKELILCNLVARREALLELGGFNEALYPNEENALMDELEKRGGELVYDPAFVVARRPRSTLTAFARMLRTYGRGRAEQFRLHPTFGSALNFVPPLFVVYLLSVVVALLTTPKWGAVLLLPIGCYLIAVLAQAASLVSKGGLSRSVAAIPLIILSHIMYGLGFWRGLITRLNVAGTRESVPVELERITPSL